PVEHGQRPESSRARLGPRDAGTPSSWAECAPPLTTRSGLDAPEVLDHLELLSEPVTAMANLRAAATGPPGSAGLGPRRGCAQGSPPWPESLGRTRAARVAVARRRGIAACRSQPAC